MKRNAIITLLLILLPISTFARTWSEQKPSETKGIPHRLSIENEKDFVTIESDTLLKDIHILIKDMNGNIMFDNNIDIVPSLNTIYVPDGFDREKYTIELYIGKKHFSRQLKPTIFIIINQ